MRTATLFTGYSQNIHVTVTQGVQHTVGMNKPIQQHVRERVRDLVRLARVAAGAALLVQAVGCASHRPAPLVVQPGTAHGPQYSGKVASLKLVTYNIWGLPGWITGAEKGRYPRIRQELQRLDPDIILIQEAWTRKARKAAPTNGLWSIARAQGQHTLFQQNGLMTLSKFPVVGGEFYPFSREAFPDRLVNKGALKVTVQLRDGRVLNVWNVHMQQGRAPEIQRSQIRELAAIIHRAEDGQIADLIGGDFNCTPGSALCRELEASLGPSLHSIGGDQPVLTWNRFSEEPGGGKTLDYIFFRGRVPFQYVQATQRSVFAPTSPEQQLSDHLGIEAVLNLEPATGMAQAMGSAFGGPRALQLAPLR